MCPYPNGCNNGNVPESGSLAMLASGLCLMGVTSRRRQRLRRCRSKPL